MSELLFEDDEADNTGGSAAETESDDDTTDIDPGSETTHAVAAVKAPALRVVDSPKSGGSAASAGREENPVTEIPDRVTKTIIRPDGTKIELNLANPEEVIQFLKAAGEEVQTIEDPYERACELMKLIGVYPENPEILTVASLNRMMEDSVIRTRAEFEKLNEMELLDLIITHPGDLIFLNRILARSEEEKQPVQRIAELFFASAKENAPELVGTACRGLPEHVMKVALLARNIAKAFSGEYDGLPEGFEEKIFFAGMLHDIGKLLVPYDEILVFPGKLSNKKFEIMKAHTVYGKVMADALGFDEFTSECIHYHHEKWNGKGYPEGLSEDDLRERMHILIMGIADIARAIKEGRSYKSDSERDLVEEIIAKLLEEAQMNPDGAEFPTILLECALRVIKDVMNAERTYANGNTLVK